MKIIIDADACPRSVLQICLRVGSEENIPVWTIASFNHNIQSDHHIVVGDGPQEADLKVINQTTPGDVVVTQDWGLAALVLGKGARCISPQGREYRSGNIDFLLEERDIKAKVRRGGGRTKGPRKRTEEDDQRFERCLRRVLNIG
jgi:uncharacterized protein YaiI (UPF0178 family)